MPAWAATIFAPTARERTAGGPVVENFRLCEVVM
nr:MAG TPA: hypothetical protein [Caudoviricetes sp.]